MVRLTVVWDGPEGRQERIPLELQPNEALRRGLEGVLEQRGVGDAGRFGLAHLRRDLDLSLPVRLLGLPAGATLQIVQRRTRREMVSVAVLQQSTGEKAHATVPNNVTLGQLLMAALPQALADADQWPVLLFVNEEWCGAETMGRTLSSLGIASGQHLVRLVGFRPANSRLPPFSAPVLPARAEAVEPDCQSPPETAAPDPPPLSTAPRSFRVIEARGPPSSPPSDGAFEPTQGELRSTMAALHRQASRDRPLLSAAAVRERRRRELLAQHPACPVRFRFPDGALLEVLFDSTEPVSALHAFVRSVLEDGEAGAGAGAETEFELAISPPRRIIPRTRDALWRCDLLPNALVTVLGGGSPRLASQ